MRTTLTLAALALLLTAGCPHPGLEDCPDISGSYVLTEHCQADYVGEPFVIIQRGCDIEMPEWEFDGTVASGGNITVSGSPGEDDRTCTGYVRDGRLETDCTPDGCHVEGRASSGGGGGGDVDDPCSDASSCNLVAASCADVGDGVTRCEAGCTDNSACGSRGECLVASGEESGLCWRRCSSPSDCASGSWTCEQLVSESSQGYCVLATSNP